MPQLTVPVIFLHIAQNRHGQLPAVADVRLHFVHVIHQLQEKQAHGDLIDSPAIRLPVLDGPNQILDEILNRQHLRHLKVHIPGVAGVTAQAIDNELPQGIGILLHHAQHIIKKYRLDDEVYSNVIFSRRENFLLGLLV